MVALQPSTMWDDSFEADGGLSEYERERVERIKRNREVRRCRLTSG